jgi:hypothetical protein
MHPFQPSFPLKVIVARLLAVFGQVLTSPDLLSALGRMLLGLACLTYCAAASDLLRPPACLDRFFALIISFNPFRNPGSGFDLPISSLLYLLRNPDQG